MITVEHVTKTHGAFTAVDAGIQIFTERCGQAIFGTRVLAGDRVKGVGWVINLAVAELVIRRSVASRPSGAPVMTAPDPPLRVPGPGASRRPRAGLARRPSPGPQRHHEPHRPNHRPAHVHGVLTKLGDLGVTLIAVTPAGSPQTTIE